MANVFRRAFRRLLDRELGVVGDELARLEHRVQDVTTQLEAFGLRYERLLNRVGMRLSRAERGEATSPATEWQELLKRDQEGRRGNGEGHGVDGDFDYPDFRSIR